LLALVFAGTGIAKLGDYTGVRTMVADFGFPARLTAPLAGALVCGELGVAAALAIPPLARAGGLGALALLVAFSAVISLNVAHGRRPACHCFGRLRSAEVGWPTVARNALPAAVAGFVAADGRFLPVLAALAALATGAWLVLGPRKPPPLRAGARAPAFSLADQAGQKQTLESLLTQGRPVLLVFSDSACGACRDLMPRVARWQDEFGDVLTVAVVSTGPPGNHRAAAREHGLRRLLADEDRSVTAAYRIAATPSAVVVDAGRLITAGPAAGADEITGLLARAAAPGRETALGRRALLRRTAAGAAALTLPLIASACASARTARRAVRPRHLKIDGAWLCDQRYALCTSAACKPSTTNPNISVCRCKVSSGYSVGFKSCQQRAPKDRQLHSNFSLQSVTSSTRVMTCTEHGLWVQCLDVICEVDPADPGHALCRCVNMKTRNFLTFGGNCDTRTCASVIWSATTVPLPGGAQYEKGLRQLGIPYRAPRACPAPARQS
jgi:peroxiredoxin